MAVSPAVDAEHEVTSTDPVDPSGPATVETTRSSGRARVVVLAVLVLALLTSAGVLVWLLADRRGQADGVQAEREAVMAQTDQFVLRLNTYGPDLLDDQGKMPDYAKRVTAVITPKFAADFEEQGLPIAESTVKEAGYGRSATILGTGVESIDADSASVIVAASLTASQPDPKHPNDESKRIQGDADVLRWEVDLVKVDGSWLVDGYTAVASTGSAGTEGE